MNTFVPSRYVEFVRRLALGVEAVDALTGRPVDGPLQVSLDPRLRAELAGSLAVASDALAAHGNGRWSLLYRPGTQPTLDIRLFETVRRTVPRRLRLTIPTEADVLAAEAGGAPVPVTQRYWRITLYPGAAYPVAGGATGVRGYVHRAGVPARWARIEARMGAQVVGSAQGDDRGEFLLLLAPTAGAGAELPASVDVTITAHGPDPLPVAPAWMTDAFLDPLSDVPLELGVSAPEDAVTRGETLPPAYQPGVSATQTVPCPLGHVTSWQPPFDLA